MKSRISENRIFAFALAIILIASLSGCKDMFKDPLSDKDTGKKVTIFLMDPFKTTIDIELRDYKTDALIDNEEITISFLGDDASNLITFKGKKLTRHVTSTGKLAVAIDPNIVINPANPLELTVFASGKDYFPLPQSLEYTTEGIKNVIVKLRPKADFKSMSSGGYGEPFDMIYNGVTGSPDLEFFGDIHDAPTGTAYDYINMYSPKVNGTLLCNNLRDKALYDDYGVYYLGSPNYLLPPDLPTRSVALNSGDYVYSTVKRTGMEKCDVGLTIHIDRSDGQTGTGVFDYVITFSDGTTKTGTITCTFPSDNLIEPVYYPGSDPAVNVELLGDSQYTLSDPVTVSTPCGSQADFVATPDANLKTYQLITQYSCPDSNVGMGLSIMGEFRKTGSPDNWTSFEFVEGICELLLVADADYDFRVNIDGEYYQYTVPTDPDRVAEYLTNNQKDDYVLNSLSISSTATKVTINVDVEFAQGICDAIK